MGYGGSEEFESQRVRCKTGAARCLTSSLPHLSFPLALFSPTFFIFILLWLLWINELLALLGQTAQTDNQHREDQDLPQGDIVQKIQAKICDVTQQQWSRLN